MVRVIHVVLAAIVAACVALTVVRSPVLAQSGVPSAYDAVTDRGTRPKPALVHLGSAGFSFNDPMFGSRLWRVTDAQTRPGNPNRSFRTPSGTHQSAWSAGGSYFYVMSNGGTVIPFAFDAASGAARRIDPSSGGDGGVVLRFYIEPQFSLVSDNIIFGSQSGRNLHTVDQYDFNSGVYTTLLDLETLVPDLKGTYIGGIASSAGDTERILTFFGGIQQDYHHDVVVFDRANARNRRLLDTQTSTLDGRPLATRLDFKLHHAFIDRSGRYVLLYPTSADRDGPRKADPFYVWDLSTNAIAGLPIDTAHSAGHDAIGFGVAVNKDCCVATPWDAAQWQIRSLAAPAVSRDLLANILSPKEVLISDHPTWNNAQPDRLVPFVSALYRYGVNDVPWRAWDDEIVAVQTNGDPGSDAQVWRFAHHRSDVRDDRDPAQWSFWYTPRANVSPDGRWVLFTSNWEKTLGTDPQAAAGEQARQDVFLVQLRAAPDAQTGPPLPPTITTTALPEGKRNTAYAAAVIVVHAQGVPSWRVSRGGLPPGLSLDPASGIVRGTPTASGGWLCAITVTDATGSATENYMVIVRR